MGSLTYTIKGERVVFSDGTILPLVRGGSDAPPADAAPEAAPEAPAEAGPSRDPAGRFAPSPAGGRAETEPDFHSLAEEYESLAAGEGETVTLPKDKLSRWNDEHKRYRERWQPVERAFTGLHEEDQRDILAFVGALNDETARPQAVQWMRQVLDRLSPAEQEKVVAAVEAAQAQTQPAEPEDEFDPFDTSQVDARIERKARELLEAREAEANRTREVERQEQQLRDRGKALGYDPQSNEYAWLLLTAQRQFADDPDPLGRAHEAIERQLNDRAMNILKAKRADAQQETVPPEGAAPSGRTEPRTMDEAAASARQRIDRIFTGPVGTS